MNCEPKFYTSKSCNNIVEVIGCNEPKNLSCCGEPMVELVANTSEGAAEKHIPVVEQEGSSIRVQIGSIFHPMSEEHSISWVYLQTRKGGQRIDLQYTEEPVAKFVVAEGDSPVAAYAYCNLHGFWKTDIN